MDALTDSQKVRALAGKGVWQYNNGSTWISIADGMFLQHDTLVRFLPTANWNTLTPTMSLQARLVETSGAYSMTLPPSGTLTTVGIPGGATPFSAG